MKRVLCLFQSLVFLVCFVGSAAAADGFAGQYHEIECAGHDEAEPSSSRYDSDRIKRKTFTHPLQDINGAPVAVMTVTVVGMYSQVDHYCSMQSLSCSITGTYSSLFSHGHSISGEYAYLTIYFNGTACLLFTYRIYENGTITESVSYY